MKQINKNEFIDVCKNSVTMAEASRKLNMHFNTFKKYAVLFDCYKPNKGGKGLHKNSSRFNTDLDDILNGKCPDYQTFKLKKRMIDSGYIKDECELCGWKEKRKGELYTPCELHHKDGNPHNHLRNNLILLCPNCHSLTNTHRSKNRARSKETSDVNAG